MNWKDISSAPDGVKLLTCIIENGEQRNTAYLIKQGNLFFFPDMSMYVYYTPTHWDYAGD